MKNIYLALGLLITVVVLSGCQENIEPAGTDKEAVSRPGSCQEEAVEIEGYGEKGKRLSNCFVEYPGEPSRQDKSYYIVEDICGQFTKEFIQEALGKPVIRAEKPKTAGIYNCSYYLDDKNYIMLNLNYLTIDNQKKGQEMMGRTTKEESVIPMKNLVVYQEDGLINSLYLVLGENKFISFQRSSGSGLTNEELIGFAGRVAEEIKNYK